MTINEYFQKCINHNWFYGRGDYKQYKAGTTAQSTLRQFSKSDPTFIKIFYDFYKWANGSNFPKPELKNYTGGSK